MLEVTDLEVRYGAIRAVRGISLRASQGELVALIGANGAGKSSTLMSIAGALKPAAGSVRFDRQDITGARPEAIVRRGIATVPETRDVFPDLTVDENLTPVGFMESFASVDKIEDVVPTLVAFGASDDDLDEIRVARMS